MTIEPLAAYFEAYDQILDSMTACNARSYKACPLFLVPRVLADSVTVHDHDDYIVVQSRSKTAPVIVPVRLTSPGDYYLACRDVVERYGGVFDIDLPFGRAFEQRGYEVYKRPWGDHDFFFETAHLADLPGKRAGATRRDTNKLLGSDYTWALLDPAFVETVNELETRWAAAKQDLGGSVGNHHYAGRCLSEAAAYPEAMRFRALGAFDPDDELAGVCMACRITRDIWCMAYRFVDPGRAGVAATMMRVFAQTEFADLPYELDGPGGAPTNPLYHFKQRLLSDSVLDRQVFSRLVKVKRG